MVLFIILFAVGQEARRDHGRGGPTFQTPLVVSRPFAGRLCLSRTYCSSGVRSVHGWLKLPELLPSATSSPPLLGRPDKVPHRAEHHSAPLKHLRRVCAFSLAIVAPSRHTAAPADEGVDEVVDETPAEVAEDGERAIPESAADTAVVVMDPVDDPTAAAGEAVERICCR